MSIRKKRSLSSGSRKTRIETFSILSKDLIVFDCLSSGSRKTRIETLDTKGQKLVLFSCLSSGSRKTRIETVFSLSS